MKITLSHPKRLGKTIPAWGVRAKICCPQSKESKVCEKCYANSGTYLWKNSINLRKKHETDWREVDWIESMVAYLKKEKSLEYFRWFDSGDIYNKKLAKKILDIIKQTKKIKHWIPTRMYKDKEFHGILKKIDMRKNAIVRFSGDNIYKHARNFSISSQHGSKYGSIVVDKKETANKIKKQNPQAKICKYDIDETTCDKCLACWDKNIPLIIYILQNK